MNKKVIIPELCNLIDTYNSFGITEEDYIADMKDQFEDDWLEYRKKHNFTEDELPLEKYATEVRNHPDKWEWIGDTSNMYLDDFMEGYTGDFDEDDHNFVIVGNLGLWNGTPSVGKVCMGDNIFSAIRECFSGCDDVIANYNTKTKEVEVEGMHHDGSNSFCIRQLTQRGINFYHNHEYEFSDAEMANKLYSTKGLSKGINFYRFKPMEKK